MYSVSLPDGNKLIFEQPTTVLQVAKKIGAGLAKAALAGKLNGKLVDLDTIINDDSAIQIITGKDAEGLSIIRHSTAHLLAQAVRQLFSSVKVTIGPEIENGFYYDFAFERPFTPDDLEKIEQKMQELAKQNIPLTHKIVSRNDAIKLFKGLGENYKVQILEEIPEAEEISLYQQGDFIDPCRGPHVPSTDRLKAFKLTKVAGAYWRGDSNNIMLQRIYGTSWNSKQDLQSYLERLAEAEKRDHRKLAKAMDLFHLQEEAPGMVFWHNNGWIIYQNMIEYMRNRLCHNGYQEVNTPIFMDRSLWEKSGHWDKFKDNMFTVDVENRVYAAKPMNCPGNIQIFNQGLKSYRDLPIKMGEFGLCHRNEASGTLFGLMRIRQFTQDDAHVYCTEEQLEEEIIKLIDFVYETYHDFGFEDVHVRLATRPENRIGSDDVWDQAEGSLIKALELRNIEYELAPGEGAFYGPKYEFLLRDCLGRMWQCGTIQVDFSMPERLGAYYIAEDGSKKVPVMIHRAILGSMERFIGILLEHYAGVLPLWLAPVQAIIMNITDSQGEYVQKITKNLKNLGLRVNLDLRNEKIGFKIREHTLARVPYLLVAGDREMANDSVAVRTQQGEDLGIKTIQEFTDFLVAESMPPHLR